MDSQSHIVVGVDGSAGSLDALEFAGEEARLRKSQLEIVWAWRDRDPPSGPWGVQLDEHEVQLWAQKRLEEIATEVESLDRANVVVRALDDAPASALIESGRRADLLVVGARGHGGFLGLRVGSVSEKVMSHAPCPVVIVRPDRDRAERRSGGRIVVGVDGSEHSRDALRWALREAAIRSLPVLAVHGWGPPPPTTPAYPYAAPSIESLEGAADSLVEGELEFARAEMPQVAVEGRPICAGGSAALIAAAEEASLVVVGSRGLGGLAGLLLGSVGRQVTHHAECSVAVIPSSH